MTEAIIEVTAELVPELVASVGALFAEDAGQHDPQMDNDWPRLHGAAFRVTAYAANETAIAFYRSHGFAPFELVLRRTV